MDIAKPSYRWSLRQQLVMFAAICGLAWIAGLVVRHIHLRSEFVRLGCDMLVTTQRPLGGIDQFGLRFRGARFDDAVLTRAMRVADDLNMCHHTVLLEGTQVSDVGVAALCRWSDLKVVVVNGGNITDNGVQRLKELAELEHLEIDGRVYVSTRRPVQK